MGRSELERLSKDELIELVLRLQQPEKTSRTSSKPPSTDRKEQREKSKPGGAKPGHEGHSRPLSERADRIIDHVRSNARAARRLWPAICQPSRSACTTGSSCRRSSRRLSATDASRCGARPAGPGLRGPGCRSYAGFGQGHAVRAAAACGGDLPQNL